MLLVTPIAKRRVALLVTPLLLTLLLLSPFGARVASADEDSVDLEDASEKATDLRRAKANGDISPDRLVIVYERATSPNDPERARVRARVGGKLLKADRAIARDVIRVKNGEAAARAADARRIAGVRDAYPDAVAVASLAVNDPLLADEWGVAKIQAPIAWDTSQGSGVKVAVLDCGIHATHPDIAGKVVLARDFARTGTTDDLCNHGTHVAGTIAANTNNGIGVAGVAPAAQLLNGKVLDDTGSGFFSDIETAMVWAANNGAKVINMSLGANIACPASTQNAVSIASATAVIVAAAGNSRLNRAGAPANCVGVIGVAATDSNDAKAGFSNYGTNVDVAAPGVSIVSSVNPNVNAGAEYAFFSGTSMATPHAAGVAALIWGTTYGTSPMAVQNRLFTTADAIPGTGTFWTYGRINAAAAVAGGAFVPDTTPPVFSAVASSTTSTTATITWTTNEPASSQVEYWTNLTPVSATPVSDTSPRVTSHSVTITGLGASTTYTFHVKSADAAGNAAQSADSTFTTQPPPPPPPSVTGISPTSGTAAGGTTVTVSGSGFSGATAVRFGTASAALFTIVTDVQITATSPAGTGTVNVTVANAGGSSVGSAPFTYGPTVSSVSPAAGPPGGGTSVTVNGTGFSIALGATTVSFGASAATSVSCASATQCTATSPAGSGTVDITVTVNALTSPTSASDQFTYVADTTAPTISGVAARAVTNTSERITWTTNELATSVVEYWVRGTTTVFVAQDPVLVTSHSVTLTGLTQDTKYNYRVRSADASGNVATSATFLFRTIK